ncbi:MAG: DUF5107 domain-containing protein [Prevotella sp.]|nr:DUF5107 domain-containing protein [Prevotella sp.]
MVKAWREMVTIPTYEVGRPDKNPMFLEKRVYQGSSGVVYPYPVIERISDEKVDKEYKAVYLENEYIKVMVLPELGGRVQMAYDKIAQRHFVYYNHVIKPALVGLVGPWISGGIEFNWPQHHRPTTFMPADCTIEEREDGSVCVWVSEMEKMFHQKGMAGFVLRPGCAYLEIHGVLYNRTDVPQTFLWWANPAVEVNDAYQSVFPPDINAVFDHGKRAVSSFPIATGTYYKMDYSAGVDISNYKNIYVPTSYMGVNSHYNFEGGYENDTQAGMLHVASHHFSPGKKQWTWGNGDFGRAWDRNLTDDIADDKGEDTSSLSPLTSHLKPGFRPYIELMAGVYTENQPDFSWLMPYEEKQFVQYFMPYRELGVVKEASKDLLVNVDVTDAAQGEQKTVMKVFATSKQQVRLVLKTDDGEVLYDEEMVMSPEAVLVKTFPLTDLQTLNLRIYKRMYNDTERCVLKWHAEPDEIRPIPDSAEAALLPEQIKTNEQLYLTGLHLEQYRHATWNPLDYYEEALRRDPNDIRCLNAMGLWYIRKGRFALAETYLRKAVKLSQKRNPNPYDSEPIYNLALALKYQLHYDEAYELFWKATWSKAWADAGFFEAAKISARQGRYDEAIDELDRSLVFNAHNQKALALKAAVLRRMGKADDAIGVCEAALKTDLFNYGCCYEKYLITKSKVELNDLQSLMQGLAKNYDELALDYQAAGLDDEAMAIWQLAIEAKAVTPMTYYYMGFVAHTQNDDDTLYYKQAEQTCSDYCFPNRQEDVIVLEEAKSHGCAMAPYYLGCLYYAARQYDLAVENWEQASERKPEFPTVWRNLALAYFNKQHRETLALQCMEHAFHLDETDARVLMELDQLYKRLHRPHLERLTFLQRYPQLIAQRDDLVLEEITLMNQVGRYEEAMQRLDAHIFHPWEGGEGKVPAQYQICRVELAKQLLKADPQSAKAKRLLEECLVYPAHLGEGKLYGAQDNDFLYFLGRYEEGTAGPTEPAAAMYYNDAKPDKIFYAGLCYRKLGQEDKARGLFNKLINYGKQHIFERQVMDYFAVSLPDLLIWEDSLDLKNQIHCKYMLALGYYGLGDKAHALRYLAEVEALDNNHQGIQQFRSLINLL